MSFLNTRLVDTFILGPFQMYIALKYINNNPLLKWYLFGVGLFSFIWNTHNYFYIDTEFVNQSYMPAVHRQHGKYQIHRVYNLLIMYPVYIYVLNNYSLSPFTYTCLMVNIIVGIVFNLYHYLNISEEFKHN
jgi:hypothetical protein